MILSNVQIFLHAEKKIKNIAAKKLNNSQHSLRNFFKKNIL